MPQPEVSIAIVAYNALDKLTACLDSVARQEGLTSETILVDNASAEPVAATVRSGYPWVELFASPINLGFAGGTNRAMEAASGRLLLWLNPDTEFPGPDTLARLLARFDESLVDVLGCRLELSDGAAQVLPRALPDWRREIRDLLHLLRPAPPAPWPAAATVPVETITGACLLTSREVWEAVGPLDPNYFMYLEDADWCRRAAAQGFRLAVAPEVTVVHHEGASYGGRGFTRREHYWRSLLRYVAKHDGPFAARGLRAALAVTAAAKLLASPLDRSPARADRRRLLWSQLRLGLLGT